MKQVKSFTIDRRKWGRNNKGGEHSGSSLRHPKEDTNIFSGNVVGKQCCLGFCARAFGISQKKITGISMPAFIKHNRLNRVLPPWLLSEATKSDVNRLANINDDSRLTDAQKEMKIIAIFAKHGIKVKFTH